MPSVFLRHQEKRRYAYRTHLVLLKEEQITGNNKSFSPWLKDFRLFLGHLFISGKLFHRIEQLIMAVIPLLANV